MKDGSCRILFVEDDPLLWRAFERTMEGCSVDLASRGDSALDMLASQVFDVLIADLLTRDLSGLDLLCRARELSPRTRRVLLAGYLDAAAVVQALNQTTIDQLIVLPWNGAELREAIAHVARVRSDAAEAGPPQDGPWARPLRPARRRLAPCEPPRCAAPTHASPRTGEEAAAPPGAHQRPPGRTRHGGSAGRRHGRQTRRPDDRSGGPYWRRPRHGSDIAH
jgi:CheY-like chemotaxis protein